MNEVFKRLAVREKPLFDESHKELPLPEHFMPGKEPLFMAPLEEGTDARRI